MAPCACTAASCRIRTCRGSDGHGVDRDAPGTGPHRRAGRARARGIACRTPLRIVGGDTKRFYGRPVAGETLALAGHHGVLRYDPAELVITARGGTLLAEIEALLARHGQRLPFEPPSFGSLATLGGTVAAGLAGPARVARGPVRDYVLGARLLTGDGRVLKFGGEVMKNVAGYDVSRLLAGSLGILGVLLDVSLKVLPVARSTRTLRRRIAAQGADRPARRSRSTRPPAHRQFLEHRRTVRPPGRLPVGPGRTRADDRRRPAGRVGSRLALAQRCANRPMRTSPRRTRSGDSRCRRRRRALRCSRPIGSRSNGTEHRPGSRGVERQTIDLVTRTAGGHATLFRRDDAADGVTGEVFAPLPSAAARPASRA